MDHRGASVQFQAEVFPLRLALFTPQTLQTFSPLYSPDLVDAETPSSRYWSSSPSSATSFASLASSTSPRSSSCTWCTSEASQWWPPERSTPWVDRRAGPIRDVFQVREGREHHQSRQWWTWPPSSKVLWWEISVAPSLYRGGRQTPCRGCTWKPVR